jgi:hypothetical protein
VVCILGNFNQIHFLPVLTAIVLYLIFVLGRMYKTNRKLTKRAIYKDWSAMSTARRWILFVYASGGYWAFHVELWR